MRASILSFSFVAAAMALPSSAGATVTVAFVDPGHYRDAAFQRDYHQAEDAVLQGIEKHLQRLGDRYLAPDQKLSVEILDIDLAGRLEPWRPQLNGVRMMNEITWPRIKLRYTLESNGNVTTSAEESIADMNYLAHARMYSSGDRLIYEKQMLDDWFRARFVQHRVPR
jgi:hypothetical protein